MKKTIKKLLTPENIYLNLESDTKDGIIKEFVHRLASAGKLDDEEAALQAVMDREKKMSTGMEHGIAIPHGKTDAAKHLAVALARKKEGIEFTSMDKEPAKIFIMTISPQSHSGPHLQFLAEVSKLLKDPGAREKILSARTAKDVIKIFI